MISADPSIARHFWRCSPALRLHLHDARCGYLSECHIGSNSNIQGCCPKSSIFKNVAPESAETTPLIRTLQTGNVARLSSLACDVTSIKRPNHDQKGETKSTFNRRTRLPNLSLEFCEWKFACKSCGKIGGWLQRKGSDSRCAYPLHHFENYLLRCHKTLCG